MTKKPSKPPVSGPEAGRHDSETSTVIARAVDPALLRAAGKGSRPAVPRPDPSRAKKPATVENKVAPQKASVAPPNASVPPNASAAAANAALSEVSFADLDQNDSADHTLAVRGFVLPRGAIPNEPMPSPLGSEYAFDAVRVPTFPPQPEAFASSPPAPMPMPGPVKLPSDITRIAVNVSDMPPSPASSNLPPPSSRASGSGTPSSRGRALAATMDSPRTKVPTLLVDRTTLLAARAVDKRESIVLASIDGKLDVEALAGETGFLPSETVEIVMTLVARGILSVR